MGGLFSFTFWVQVLLATIFTMACIYVVKHYSTKWNVPVVAQISQGV